MLKLCGAALLLALVLHQVPLDTITDKLKQANWPWLIAVWLLIHLAQLTSARRMQVYAASQRVSLGRPAAIGLYYKGMLYNLALPGGIGGDAYKAFMLKQRYGIPLITAGRLMLAERANGLWLLLLITAMLLPSLHISGIGSTWCWMAAFLLCFSATSVYWSIGRRLTGELPETCIAAGWWSFWSQLSVLASVAAMLLAMQVPLHEWSAYGVLFMAAAVAGILPISVAGVGVREAVYALAAPYLLLDAATGVALSLAWFGIYVLAALVALLMPSSMDSATE